ncbi:MAG: SDR family oxidoreductase [Anaerolineae bacterium]|nr:SDR family oxidoreductase [Anaerolineae bacterium]
MTTAARDFVNDLFGLEGKVAIVTGGTGVLGGAMVLGLAKAGVKVAVLGRRKEKGEAVARQITDQGGTALVLAADVMDRDQLVAARDQVVGQWGRIDILVNAAGGTTPAATVPPDKTFFDMSMEPMREIIDLNLIGTLLPSQIFGAVMAEQREGSIVNISSMSVPRAMTRSVAYSAGKAAAENFTRWLAVELSLKFGEKLRVNALAPGFFLGEQNRRLLTEEDGTLTARGKKIIDHTPAGRFGEPEELVGPLIWLCSPAAKFINGMVIMVDGGVNAFSGI